MNLKKYEFPFDISRERNFMAISGVEKYIVQDSRRVGEVKFLHDTTAAFLGDRLYVAWYNSTDGEIVGASSIVGRYSDDFGRTWSDIFTVVSDRDGSGCHYVPANLFECGGKLYAAVSKMTSHDRVVSVGLYAMDSGGEWSFVRDIGPSFIGNAPPIRLANGRLLFSGRCSCDASIRPDIPAVILGSADGSPDKWEKFNPFYDFTDHDRYNLPCPETTVWAEGSRVTAFTRNDNGGPHLVFESGDYGMTWSCAMGNPLTMSASKSFALVLRDGRRALAYSTPHPDATLDYRRRLLVLCVEGRFYILLDGRDETLGLDGAWSYPCMVEHGGYLYITATNEDSIRNAVLVKCPISSL